MKINTTSSLEKGSAFEKRSLEIIKRAIEEKTLGIPQNVVICEKPSYYSYARKKDIIFDLSIEVWAPGADRFTTVYLIECKDYSKAIPVDDVEEFFQKANQVAEGCFKAVFVANNAFQEGAFNFAETKRMMLIRAGQGTDYSIILHKKNMNAGESGSIALSHEEGTEIIIKIIDKVLDNAFTAAENPLRLIEEINLEFLAKEQITQVTKQLLTEIHPKVFQYGPPLTATVIETYLKSLGVSVISIPKNSNYLGNCDIKNKKIEINTSLINTNRYLFVLAHELGHYELHKELKIDQETYDSFSDPILNFRTNRYELQNPRHWIEWQANFFASSLILPHFALKARLWFYQDKLNMRQGILYLTDQNANNDLARKIIGQLANYFFVSKSTIIYRLKELNLLEEYSNLKSIGQIIDGYIESFVDDANHG